MRKLEFRFLAALVIIAIGLAAVGLWFAGRLTAEVPPPTFLCSGPPNYDMPDVPCSGTDFSALASLPVTEYCDLIRNPSNRNNQIVRVKGIYSYGRENSALDDPACRGENAWTWVETEPYSNFTQMAANLKQNEPAEVIFLGKFSGPNKEGYGHLNGCRYQLIVMNVEQMKPLGVAR